MNITAERLAELEDIEAKMSALEAGGVGNWTDYDTALEDYRENKQDQERFDDIIDDMLATMTEYIEEPAGHGAGFGLFGAEAALKGILTRNFMLKDNQ
jgi:hypothetical protein